MKFQGFGVSGRDRMLVDAMDQATTFGRNPKMVKARPTPERPILIQ
jgi:hypothetical protein